MQGVTRLQQLRQARSDAIKQRLDAERQQWFDCCPGCGVAYVDGFSIGCPHCVDRCHGGLRRVREGAKVPAGRVAELNAFKARNRDERWAHGNGYTQLNVGAVG